MNLLLSQGWHWRAGGLTSRSYSGCRITPPRLSDSLKQKNVALIVEYM